MTAAPYIADEARTRSGFILTALMMIALPLVAIQGPAHTTPMDAVNFMFVIVYWAWLFARRERIPFPLMVAFWLIMVGSCTGMYAAEDKPRAILTIFEDLYLYSWFVTLTDFLSRRARPSDAAILWVGVACTVAFATLADAHLGLFGGRFAGTKRATGTFENPNMFGDYLTVSFFVAWSVAAARRRWFYLTLPLLLGGIFSTASNGALVSLIGGTSCVIAAHEGFWKPRQLGAMLIIGGLLFGIVGTFHDQIQQFAVERLSSGRGQVGGAAMKGASERLPIWENIFKQVLDKPTGVGPGNFGIVDAMTTGDDHAAHSEYLGMLAERGVIGFAGWCGVMIGIFLMILRLRTARTLGFEPLGVEQLYGLFGAMGAHALVIELSHFRHTWMVFAVLASAAAQATRLTTTAAPAADLDLAEAA